MFKYFFILAIGVNASALAQKINPESYRVYSALITSKIRDTSKANLVVKKLITDTLYFFEFNAIVNTIKQEDAKDFFRYDVLSDFEYDHKLIDSLTKDQILSFYPVAYKGGTLKKEFHIKTKVILVKKIPEARNQKDYSKHYKERWNIFYEKYPQAGFVFIFSKIYFSEDNKTAIFMYGYTGRKFMGEAALAIMENNAGNWHIKYELDLRNQTD